MGECNPRSRSTGRLHVGLVQHRSQRTIGDVAEVRGFGLFSGVDVTLRFCPAGPDEGIAFQRTDQPGTDAIPALIDQVLARPRCTVLSNGASSVAVVEHVLAALAGLGIDNCLIRIDGPEPPACDGSSAEFVGALQASGIVEQDAARDCYVVDTPHVVTEFDDVGIGVQPARQSEYEIGFVLDYGPGPIARQVRKCVITPDSFSQELAACRTFILESEVHALQSQGIGLRATPQNVLVFSDDGPIDNALRAPDECVKHKILDCVGDFSLLGCDIVGRFTAMRSGHRLNHQIVRELRSRYVAELADRPASPSRHAAHCGPHPPRSHATQETCASNRAVG